jgi:WD40 repeat protein
VDANWAASLWEPLTGRRIARIPDALRYRRYIDTSAFSPDGSLLALPQDRAVSNVGVADGQEKSRLHFAERLMSIAAFSPDGGKLALATTDGMRVYDARTGEPLGPVIGKKSLYMSAKFDFTGHRLVVVGQMDESGLWDWQTGKQVLSVEGKQWEDIPTLAESPDGRWLAVYYGGDDHTTLYPVPKVE